MFPLSIVLMFVLPAVLTHVPETPHGFGKGNLRAMVQCLQMYHSIFDVLPPPYVADESGRPLSSWRVLMLRYLEEGQRYEQYDFAAPWNSPQNLQLVEPTPSPFQSRPYRGPDTRFFLLTSETTYSGQIGRNLPRAEDIVVVWVRGQDVTWTEPRDFDYLTLLAAAQSEEDFAALAVADQAIFAAQWDLTVRAITRDDLLSGELRFFVFPAAEAD